MRWSVLVAVAACASPSEEAEDPFPPGPPNPYGDQYDDPSDFPKDNCTPGALADFAHSEIWFSLSLRTEIGASLRTFMARHHGDEEIPHLHTADELFVRDFFFTGTSWVLRSVYICGADADGTLRGAEAFCHESLDGGVCRDAVPFEAAPFRRLEGEGDGEHLTLLGEIGAHWPAVSSNVRVDGDLAYVSRFEDDLRIVSIANPAAPVELGHVALSGAEYANDLKLVTVAARRYAITASHTANVIDVTDPANPQLVAPLPFSPHSVFVEGTMLYLVDGFSSRVQVWDLANPRLPDRVGDWDAFDLQFAWHDIFVENGVAYLSDMAGSGMHVVDFRTPANPVVLGAEADPSGTTLWHSPWVTRVFGKTIAIDGSEFSTPGMRLLDGEPGSPTFLATLGEWSLARGSAHNLMAIGNRVYLAHYRDGVRVVDITNLAEPQQIGYFNTWPTDNAFATAGDLGAYGIDLDPARKRIYVADSVRGLVILQGDSTVFP